MIKTNVTYFVEYKLKSCAMTQSHNVTCVYGVLVNAQYPVYTGIHCGNDVQPKSLGLYGTTC